MGARVCIDHSIHQDYGPTFWRKSELLAVNDAMVAAERRAAAAAVHTVTTDRLNNIQHVRLFVILHLQQDQLVSHPDGSYACARCGELFAKVGHNAKSRARNKRRAWLHACVQCKSRLLIPPIHLTHTLRDEERVIMRD
jgi:DNA-directed RNA polymerase subunit RPC12/RpoP